VIYCSTVLMIFSGLAVGAVPLLRWQEPNLSRPYRMPLYPSYAGILRPYVDRDRVERFL